MSLIHVDDGGLEFLRNRERHVEGLRYGCLIRCLVLYGRGGEVYYQGVAFVRKGTDG